jgi:hypothetical protein
MKNPITPNAPATMARRRVSGILMPTARKLIAPE